VHFVLMQLASVRGLLQRW